VDGWGDAKRLLAQRAAEEVDPEKILGIGSGSTVMAFIDALGKRVGDRAKTITCVVASRASEERARSMGLTVIPLESVSMIDFSVDGADAVNPDHVLIKGGGAALVRERLIIASAESTLILVDGSKPCTIFENVCVPVVVIPFGWSFTRDRLREFSYRVTLRCLGQEPFVTDDGLYILDAQFEKISDPKSLHRTLKMLDGVVDTGLFVGYHSTVWVSDGDSISLWP